MLLGEQVLEGGRHLRRHGSSERLFGSAGNSRWLFHFVHGRSRLPFR